MSVANKTDFVPQRKFVDPGFAVTGADSIKPWVDRLLDREIASKAGMVDWLEDYSELEAIIGEDMNIRYVDMTCDTKDEKKKEAYLKFVRERSEERRVGKECRSRRSPYH